MEFEWECGRSSYRSSGRLKVETAAASWQAQVLWNANSSSSTSPQNQTATPSSQPAAAAAGPAPRAIAEAPVPLLTVGRAFAPIPAGRAVVSQPLEAALRTLGLAPVLAAASAMEQSGDQEQFLRLAVLTDPVTAGNLCMAASTAGNRRVLFVERGAAEGLARGRLQLVPKAASGSGRHLALWRGLCSPAAPWARVLGIRSDSGGAAESGARQDSSTERFLLKGAAAAAGEGGGGAAHISNMPLRLALNLLRRLPGEFVLLSDSHSRAGSGGSAAKQRKDPVEYTGADAISSVVVHLVPGLHIYQRSGSAVVEFTPAFLSQATLRHFQRQFWELALGQLLAARRVHRTARRLQLQHIVALVAAGFPGGGGGAIGGAGRAEEGEEDEEGSFDEPPEVQEMMKELGESMGPVPVGEGAVEQGSSNGVVKAAATLACGLLALLGPGFEAVAALLDRAAVALPLGGLLGVPSASAPVSEARRLHPLIAGMQEYNNQQQAASRGAPVAAGPSSPGQQYKQYAQTLAAVSLWLAVSAKIAADDPRIQQMLHPGAAGEPAGPAYGCVTVIGHQVTSVDASALDPNDPHALAAAVIASHAPTLEYNGFEGLLRAGGGGAGPSGREGRVEVGAARRLDPSALQMHVSAAPGDEGAGPPLGKGLVLIGDLDVPAQLRTPRGLSLGLDDGTKLL